MKRTLSSSRTFNNINNSTGISAADKQQITDNKNNITLLDTELTDLSTDYEAYKVSNNAALATTNSNVSTNTSAIATNTSGLAAAVGNIATNTSGLAAAVGNIATNTSGLAAAVGNISSNASAISSLTGTVSNNTSAISTNAGNTATNTAGLVVANQNINGAIAAGNALTSRVNANETTLLGKQDTLSNANTSAGNVTLRTLNFPDSLGATANLTLPGNTQLFSGNAPNGLQAKIQNGNLYNFVSLDNTLLSNVTLGATWKYQNGGGYFVKNASNAEIIEFINPGEGAHSWYGPTNGQTTVPSVVMSWTPSVALPGGGTGERLYCSGLILSKMFLHQIDGTVVRGYAMFRYQGTSGTINMNTTGGIDIPWTNIHVDGQQFLPVGTTQVKILNTGYYEVGFNVYLTSTAQRANPTIRIRVNGLDTAYLAWSYIRAASNHNESSWSLSPVLMSLTADDVISVQGRFTSNGLAGGCYLYSNSAAINKAYSSLMIKRVA